MQRRKANRFPVVVAVCGAGLVVGLVAALLFCHMVVVWTAQETLAAYANQLLHTGEDAGAETMHTLASANASPYPFCSDAEIGLLRDLAFNSRYVKDVGRIRDGLLVCSGTLGRVDPPLRMPLQPLETQSGLSVYIDVAVAISTRTRATIVQRGQANVVMSGDVYQGIVAAPFGYMVAIVTTAPTTTRRSWGDPVALSDAQVLNPGFKRIHGVLYDTACSRQVALCAATHVRVRDVVDANVRKFWIFGSLGGLAGLLLAILAVAVWQHRRSLENRLRRAIRRGGLTVSYQPIVDLASGKPIGAEALVRWSHDDGRPISAEIFVKLAEEKGFIGDITRFVLRDVLDKLRDLLLSRPDFRVNINISPADMTDSWLFEELESRIAQSGVKPAQIGLELTERSTVRRSTVINAVAQLRRRGHVVYIDDFGTGYSSLSYLAELNVDVIKIDRSFTRTVRTEALTASIVPQIVSMARTLSLGIVVEGIETAEQAEYFREMGGKMGGQGRYFSHPLAAREFLAWLDSHDA